jgi:hypothetical protein
MKVWGHVLLCNDSFYKMRNVATLTPGLGEPWPETETIQGWRAPNLSEKRRGALNQVL